MDENINNNLTYIGYRNADIIIKTTNLLKCVREINTRRNSDIYKYKKEKNIDNDVISYDVEIFNDCGVIQWLNIYKDNYINTIYSTKSIYYNIDQQHIKNIKKCINNCNKSDKKKLNWVGKGKLDHVGNIDYEHVNFLLEKQNYKCYLCNDNLITYLLAPRCCYMFSIDRLNNNKSHDKTNVKISCYFCNCKNHVLYGKTMKSKCNDLKCFCNNPLYNVM